MAKDTLTPEGAHRLSISLQNFWKSKGLDGVRVAAVRIRLNTTAVPANIWAIRSNLTFDGNGNATVKEKIDDDPTLLPITERKVPEAFWTGSTKTSSRIKR